MYEEFLKQIEDFMFIEDKPEKADVIFVPGNGYPNRSKKASISKTDILKWRKKQRSCTGMGLHQRSCPVEDTVSQQGDLQEFLTRKNVIVGHTKRNGIF